MARSSILDRFRPVGAPGPAGPVGVPSTDVPGYVSELVPVFAALDADIDRARGAVQEAQAWAADAEERARADAAAEIARARREAGAERAAAAAAVAEAAAEDDARLIVEAQEAADAIGRASAARLPGIVRTVVEQILHDHLGEAR